MVRGLLLLALGAAIVGFVDAAWGTIWKVEGWIIVCLTFLIAAQVAERMRS